MFGILLLNLDFKIARLLHKLKFLWLQGNQA